MGEHRERWVLPVVLVVVYLVMSLAMLVAWSVRGVYTVTGDEPHYLVMADSMVRHQSLELTQAYRDEFTERAIFTAGLAPPGVSAVAGPQAQVITGPGGGAYSWHGVGIPVVVAIPFALGGVLGAKLALTVLGAGVVLLAWRLSGLFLGSARARFWAVLTVAIAYPLIPATTQIYPDLVAGMIVLLGVVLLLTRSVERRWWVLALTSAAMGFLPWLMTKFAPASLVLLAAMTWVVFRRRRSPGVLVAMVAPALLLYVLLAVWNLSVFGSLLGQSPEGNLQGGATALMLVAGLILDQDQGILVQNLALWVGVFGLAAFLRHDRRVFVVWTIVFITIWVPSAMHPGLYGGGSFVGRYSWALALLMIVPMMAGFGVIRAWSTRAFAVIVAIALGWSLAHLALFALVGGSAPGSSHGIDLYTKPAGTWLENYAVFTFPAQQWWPAFFDVDWAFAFLPNAIWLLLVLAVALAGWRPRLGLSAAAVLVVAIAVAGAVSSPGARLLTQAGPAVAVEDAGFASTGPRQDMRWGDYAWSVEYAAQSPRGVPAGRWELIDEATGQAVAAGELPGTEGRLEHAGLTLPYRSVHPHGYVLRIASYGKGPFMVHETSVAHA